MATRGGRTTIHDVARLAGVSVTTVSHSFSGNRVVSAETRRRVREAATELGYRPDVLAQSLRRNRLGVIALVARSLEDRVDLVQNVDYFLRFTGAAAVAALGARYGLMLVADPARPDAPGAALACDGFLITEPETTDPLVDMLTAAGIPVVTVGDTLDTPRPAECVVDIGARRLTALVLDHLAAGGARRIAFVNGTDHNEWCVTSENLYREWTAARGMPATVVSVAEDRGPRGGRDAVDDLIATTGLAGQPPPDGYYCLTAAQATGAVGRLAELGLRVPGDVQVAAGSDAEECRMHRPSITSIDFEPERLARRAVAALLRQLRDGADSASPDSPAPSTEVGRLIVRESTRPG